MQTEGSGLTRLQEKAIEGLLATDTRAAAADYAGCSERSIYKWLNDPVFKSKLLERENTLRREVGRLLAIDAKEARRVIKEIMLDTKEDSRLRARAGQILLSYMIKTQDQTDIERRLSALELKA
jgi:hypothetical protein